MSVLDKYSKYNEGYRVNWLDFGESVILFFKFLKLIVVYKIEKFLDDYKWILYFFCVIKFLDYF